MKARKIEWNNDGWTTIQDADPEKHVLEISCFAENGNVTEIRKRHQDGEEEKITKAIDKNHSLPMSVFTFRKAFEEKEIQW